MQRVLALLSLAALGAGALVGGGTRQGRGHRTRVASGRVQGRRAVEDDFPAPRRVLAGDPGLRIHHVETGRALTFSARPTQNQRAYRIDVVFLEGGLWNVQVFGSVDGRAYVVEAGPFSIGGRPMSRAPSQAATVSAGFPVWPALGGALGLVLPAAAGAAFFIRRRNGHQAPVRRSGPSL